jgi:hypothetical protein
MQAERINATIDAAITEALDEKAAANFTSPLPPVKQDPAFKSGAMSKYAYSYYDSAERYEREALSKTKRTDRATEKTKKKHGVVDPEEHRRRSRKPNSLRAKQFA